MHTIYTIVHPVTGIYYIGRTNNFSKRKTMHLSELRRGVHSNSKLQEVYNQDSNILWYTQDVQSGVTAKELEKIQIEANRDDPKLANYHLAKASDAMLSQFTEDRRNKISERMTGTRHTDETRKLMRIRQKDSRVSDAALSKASDVNRKEIMIDGVVYRTASDAAVALNVHVSTVLNRARNLRCRWDTWKIIDRG